MGGVVVVVEDGLEIRAKKNLFSYTHSHKKIVSRQQGLDLG
jgi:hypothetical protein